MLMIDWTKLDKMHRSWRIRFRDWLFLCHKCGGAGYTSTDLVEECPCGDGLNWLGRFLRR